MLPSLLLKFPVQQVHLLLHSVLSHLMAQLPAPQIKLAPLSLNQSLLLILINRLLVVPLFLFRAELFCRGFWFLSDFLMNFGEERFDRVHSVIFQALIPLAELLVEQGLVFL